MNIFVPYTEIQYPTKIVLAPYPERHEVRLPPTNDGYPRFLSERWKEGKKFINVEHDMVFWPGALEQIWECEEDWCVFGHWKEDEFGTDRGGTPYLGVAKFSEKFISETQGVWDDWKEPCWTICDCHLYEHAKARGLKVHQHFPPVVNANPRYLWNVSAEQKTVIDSRHGMQKPEELFELVRHLLSRDVRSIVEIGVINGGNLAVFKHCFPNAIIMGIDMVDVSPVDGCVMIKGDSHDAGTVRQALSLLPGEPIDFVFIDGDHSYEAVKRDYGTWAPHARIIGLHDVVVHPGRDDIGAWRLWEEIKAVKETKEIICRNEDGTARWAGIGLVAGLASNQDRHQG